MKKWFKRNGVELVLGIGLTIFIINFLTYQDEGQYIISVPLVVFGLIRLYQRHFGPRYYSAGESFFAYSTDDDDEDGRNGVRPHKMQIFVF